jgi:eukaryotic-like serine/threonine-protein kinase
METDARVDGLIDRWDEMHERGTPVTIEELCVDCPELVEDLRRRIEALRNMDSVLNAGTNESGSPSAGQGRNGTATNFALPDAMRASAVFRPERHHAQGGLGEVLTAHQEELDRLVAIKRIRPDKLHDAARRRFLREAAITARLQHPGIVPIYGLGQDVDGPFYTMPFIQGQTFQEVIEAFHGDESPRHDPGRRSLRFRALLQQFITVCNTMAYVHDQGVVHRDLKPSNIMLGPYGETLVLDWGLAKRLGGGDLVGEPDGDILSPSPSPENLTATGAVMGTPQYMSPEQAKGEPAGPSTDIFNLGLVLYAILTGKSAFADDSFRGADPLKAVREATVMRPRSRDPHLPRALEGVCLQALAERPGDRYPSPRDLAKDIENWLADEPVSAWQEPFSMRARRWARRNRTAVTGALVALVVSVIGLLIGAVVQARAKSALEATNLQLTRANAATTKARNEAEAALGETKKAKRATEEVLAQSEESRKRAEAVLTFLKDDVLAAARPEGQEGGLGREVTVRKAVDSAEAKIAETFGDQPTVEAVVRDTLGLTYSYLGDDLLAIRQFERALKLRRAKLGSDHPDTLTSRSNLALSYYDVGRTEEALGMLEETLKLRASKLGLDHPDTLTSRNNLALSYHAVGRTAEAIKLLEPFLTLSESKLGSTHPDTLTSRNNLAAFYHAAGRTTEAIKLIEPLLTLSESKLGSTHPDTLRTRNNLAALYHAAGRTAEAIKLDKVTLELSESKLGPDHPHTLTSRNNLAEAYRATGRTAEAINLHEVTLKLSESKLGPNHPHTLTSRNNLGFAYYVDGRIGEAIKLFEGTLEFRESKLGLDHADTLRSRNNLAESYRSAGLTAKAIKMHEETLKLRESKLGLDHPDTLESRNNLAESYLTVGRTPEAIKMHEGTLKLKESKLGPDHPHTLMGRSNLANAYVSLGRWAEAERLLRDTLARHRKVGKSASPLLAGDLANLGSNLLHQAKWPEAEAVLRECLEIRATTAPDVWSRFSTMSQVGGSLLGQKKYSEAEPLVVAGYEGMKARETKIPAAGRPRLAEAAVRVVRLYEGWGKPEHTAAWKTRLGLSDLPANVFATN